MIVEVDLRTFEEFLDRQSIRAVYTEDEDEFTLIQSLDALILRATVSKLALFTQMKAQMEDTAAQAARDSGLEVDSAPSLPSDEEIMAQAVSKFEAEHLEQTKKALRIVEPELAIRGL